MGCERAGSMDGPHPPPRESKSGTNPPVGRDGSPQRGGNPTLFGPFRPVWTRFDPLSRPQTRFGGKVRDLRVVSAGGMSAPSLNGELGGILRVGRVGGCPGQPALGSNTLIDALNRPRARSPGGSLGRVAACTLIYVSFGEPPATSRAHHPSQAHHIAWFRWSGGVLMIMWSRSQPSPH